MKRVYTTANGKRVNIDAIIAQNEDTIAVGNMKVNARGDQLGPGGKVDNDRNKVLSEYYKLNTPVATNSAPRPRTKETRKDLVDDWIEPVEESETTEIEQAEEKPILRGKLADSLAKTKSVTIDPTKKKGPTRI